MSCMAKRIAQLPAVRVDEELERALMRLAAREDRSLSDYLWRVLRVHVHGHAASLDSDAAACNACLAAHCRSPAEVTR